MKENVIEHFGVQRRIVASKTLEGWKNIPHAVYVHEADVTDFLAEFKKINDNAAKNKVNLNTVLLKLLCEGIKKAPRLNAHLEFNKHLIRGKFEILKSIDITMPMIYPSGEMMTLTLYDFGSKTLPEMQTYINDLQKRLNKTNLAQVMIDASMHDTLHGLKKFKFVQAFRRVASAKLGKHRIKTLKGREKKEYYAIPKTERLSKANLKPGSVTISNVGSIYKGKGGFPAFLDIIPPQVSAFALGVIQEKPYVLTNKEGEKDIGIRKIMPLCIAFDHKALDFDDVIPFLEYIDTCLEKPSMIKNWW